MKIINEELMDEFRDAPRCEWCKKPTRGRLDPHHLWKRGIGGGWRLDCRLNLISLCRPCHNLAEDDTADRGSLVAIVSQRERVTFGEQDMQELVWMLRRAPDDADSLWFNLEAREFLAAEQIGPVVPQLLERVLGEVRQAK